jgi:hypothetical protein
MLKATLSTQRKSEEDEIWDIECPFLETEEDKDILNLFKSEMEKIYSEMVSEDVKLEFITSSKTENNDC